MFYPHHNVGGGGSDGEADDNKGGGDTVGDDGCQRLWRGYDVPGPRLSLCINPLNLHKNPVSESCSVMSDSVQPHRLYVARQAPLSMGILQARILEWVAMLSSSGIFPTQGSNPGLQILYHLNHQGSPKEP